MYFLEYPASIKRLEKRSKELDALSSNNAYGAVSGHENDYLPCLKKCAPELVKMEKPVPEIQKKIDQANDIVKQ